MDADERDPDLVREAWEERRARNAHRCQCQYYGDMPGRCPGPANCPMCDQDEPEDEPAPTCSRCAAPLTDGNEGCRDPACPNEEA